MNRMKVLFCYLLVFVLIYIAFDFFTYRYLVNSYKNIKTYEISSNSPSVTIKEAKATAVNGYITAQVNNNTGKKIDKTYVKIDLYNTRGNNLETKYVKLEDFKENETKEFKINFRATNVSHFNLSFTDENVDAEIEKQAVELKGKVNKWFPFVGLITLFTLV